MATKLFLPTTKTTYKNKNGLKDQTNHVSTNHTIPTPYKSCQWGPKKEARTNKVSTKPNMAPKEPKAKNKVYQCKFNHDKTRTGENGNMSKKVTKNPGNTYLRAKTFKFWSFNFSKYLPCHSERSEESHRTIWEPLTTRFFATLRMTGMIVQNDKIKLEAL